jgi:hypothetical protein
VQTRLITIQFEPHGEQNQPVNTEYEIIAVYSKNHTLHISKQCEQNTELLVLYLAVNIVTTRLPFLKQQLHLIVYHTCVEVSHIAVKLVRTATNS